jgi:hypothetical protein
VSAEAVEEGVDATQRFQEVETLWIEHMGELVGFECERGGVHILVLFELDAVALWLAKGGTFALCSVWVR